MLLVLYMFLLLHPSLSLSLSLYQRGGKTPTIIWLLLLFITKKAYSCCAVHLECPQNSGRVCTHLVFIFVTSSLSFLVLFFFSFLDRECARSVVVVAVVCVCVCVEIKGWCKRRKERGVQRQKNQVRDHRLRELKQGAKIIINFKKTGLQIAQQHTKRWKMMWKSVCWECRQDTGTRKIIEMRKPNNRWFIH